MAEGVGYASGVALSDGTVVTITGRTEVAVSFQAISRGAVQATPGGLP